jgi:uncharacterized membrane protein YkvI
VLFQLMVFFALLECSVGFMQAFNARIDVYNLRRGRITPRLVHLVVPAVLTFGSVFIASTVGLVALISQGYRAMAYVVLAIFILPLFTLGLVKIFTLPDRRGSMLMAEEPAE